MAKISLDYLLSRTSTRFCLQIETRQPPCYLLSTQKLLSTFKTQKEQLASEKPRQLNSFDCYLAFISTYLLMSLILFNFIPVVPGRRHRSAYYAVLKRFLKAVFKCFLDTIKSRRDRTSHTKCVSMEKWNS